MPQGCPAVVNNNGLLHDVDQSLAQKHKKEDLFSTHLCKRSIDRDIVKQVVWILVQNINLKFVIKLLLIALVILLKR